MVNDCSFPYNVTLVLCLALNTASFVQTRFDVAICHPQGFLRLTCGNGEKRCRKKKKRVPSASERTGTVLHIITDGRKFISVFTTLREKKIASKVVFWTSILRRTGVQLDC